MNNLSQFWRELKRRNVVRVVSVYAAAAFVILELVSIIVEPLKLPEWTLPMIIVLLCVGFIIAVILSWIYDIHPVGGIVKTEPVHKIIEEKVATSNSWKIASYISFVVIVGLIVLNVIPKGDRPNDIPILDKSIAVLPFTYLSDESDNQYLAESTMEEILLNLSKIKDIRVMARTSVEQYRNTDKTITKICEELGVGFALEGSFLKNGDQVRLIVQLIEPGKEGHVWSKKYERNWQDIFTVQSEVAQLVANELQAVITPEEKQLIDKTPTSSLTAFDFYQRGVEQLKLYRFEDDRSALNEAEKQFYMALTYDSTFALAYVGLARIYIDKRFWIDYFSDAYMDSVLIQTNKALKFDDKLAEAYNLRGDYYYYNGEMEQSNREYEKALRINPNDWEAFRNIGLNYHEFFPDYIKAIVNMENAIIRNRGLELPSLLRSLGDMYRDAGFRSLAEKRYRECLTLTQDTASYYRAMAFLEYSNENWRLAMELHEKAINIDSTVISGHQFYSAVGLYQKQYDIYMTIIKQREERGAFIHNIHRLAYTCWKLEKYDEANTYFKQQLSYGEESIKLERTNAQAKYTQYDLAGVYAFLGQKDQAYQYLQEFNTVEVYPMWWITSLKNDPLFDKIKEEPEFQQIVRDVEAKYQAEHDRVRKWLEENDM